MKVEVVSALLMVNEVSGAGFAQSHQGYGAQTGPSAQGQPGGQMRPRQISDLAKDVDARPASGAGEMG